jgi:hypothetical protein
MCYISLLSLTPDGGGKGNAPQRRTYALRTWLVYSYTDDTKELANSYEKYQEAKNKNTSLMQVLQIIKADACASSPDSLRW